jgi:hypothetical protein
MHACYVLQQAELHLLTIICKHTRLPNHLLYQLL